MKLSDMKGQSFSRRTLTEWQEAAEKALKGKGVHSLHTNTYENIDLKPLYTEEDVPNRDRVKDYIPNVEVKLERASKWFIAQSIKRDSWEELTIAVKDALSRGQNCLSFSIGNLKHEEHFYPFLKEMIGSDTPVFILDQKTSLAIVGMGEAHELKGMHGIVGYDPLSEGEWLDEGRLEEWMKVVEEADKCLPEVKTIIVNSAPFHNKGASATQELAFALSEGVTYIETLLEKGWTLEKATEKMHFHFSIGSHFFMEIAKIRAFKKLWQEVLSSYGIARDLTSRAITISAETSRFNKSTLDPYVNMLRSGGEAFSAILAGVDYLVVAPFNEVSGNVNSFSERIARNTQLILGEEAHLDKVIDPGGGSYYVEWLSEEVGKLAWKEFQQIDAKGGMLVSLKDGSIENQMNRVRDARIHDLATRKNSMIGTNIYANLEEAMTDPPSTSGERLSLPFEGLRSRAQKSPRKPVAGLIGLGELKTHKSRADFVKGFLATGGIHAHQSKECMSKEDILHFVEETRYPYYVVCGKDEAYHDQLPMIVESIHVIDADIVIDIAGKIPDEKRNKWERMGLNGSIYNKQNILKKVDELLTIWEEGNDSEEA
ncbi:methylmalonyl-CoA mutase family protein [Rossellomorea sp. YZS02]|uniref:methylmalonyl-CoA mutase family protein n=1 Tax=Rossellomorea sp. YZS02 TaxID=3097358 RepID=UPI002A161553|nr:methylmalonyl-CoA mutase family protein [Rossellomorea sp. YZS02]MDX8344852.1 methylmalonyl-CoA mutase family protein [Rossellomorea sp. YZS02]